MAVERLGARGYKEDWIDFLLNIDIKEYRKKSKIPRVTLARFKKGQISLKSKTRSKFRNVYRKVMYARIREEGHDIERAKLYANKNPATVSELLMQTASVKDRMTNKGVSEGDIAYIFNKKYPLSIDAYDRIEKNLNKYLKYAQETYKRVNAERRRKGLPERDFGVILNAVLRSKKPDDHFEAYGATIRKVKL